MEAQLRNTSWKQLVKHLKVAVEQHHEAIELPVTIRRWLEVNRGTPKTEAEAEHIAREVRSIQWWVEAQGEGEWFKGRTETVPILGWVIEAAHVLRDGDRWWIFSARRHDDKAPLVGPTVHAPASYDDMRKLRRIIDAAGGNAKQELLRTGAITQEEHDEFIAAGKPDIAAYGRIFFWWKA
jgi:hypothetical protein